MEPKERFKKLIDKYKDDPEFDYEGLVLGIAEKIALLIDNRDMTRTELAKALSCSPAYVTKLLRGSENLTLKKLVEVSHALGARVSIDLILKDRTQTRSKMERPAEKMYPATYIHRQRKTAIVAEKKSK